jgi:L-serine dehydratase
MKTSIFDLFKIGIGPSSSHTVGPMRAARQFTTRLRMAGLLSRTSRVKAELFGSLALTGIGHATDKALLLGLSGEAPELIEPSAIESIIANIRAEGRMPLGNERLIRFVEERDLLFHNDSVLLGHPNGMRFTAYDAGGAVLSEDVYYSVGGGFIVREGDTAAATPALAVPYPFASGAELLAQANQHGLAIWQIVLANECTLQKENFVRARLSQIWSVMNECIDRGLRTEGILPGGLNVRRRAPRILAKIQARSVPDPLEAMDWVNAFAMAVNEENAAGGRVVTAPTNGAAGLVPAVGRYYLQFVPGASQEGLLQYLLTAGAIGI